MVLKYVLSYYTNYQPGIAVSDCYAEAVTFYKAVNERDDALVKNMIALMEEHKAKVATVVMGGFHTESVLERLAGRATSYVVLVPDAASIDPQSMTKYHQVMRDFRDGIAQ